MKPYKEFVTHCQQKIVPQLQALEERRLTIFAKRKFLMSRVIIALVIHAVIILFGLLPAVSIFVTMIAAPFITARLYQRKYTDNTIGLEANEIVLKNSLAFPFEELLHDARMHISYEHFQESQLFLQLPDHYGGRNLCKGKLGSFVFLASELQCGYVGAEGQWKNIFKGIFLINAFEKNFETKIIVLPNPTQSEYNVFGKKFEEVETERGKKVPFDDDPAFSQEFVAYSDKALEAPKILTRSQRDMLVRFKKQTGVEVYLSIINNKTYFAFHSENFAQIDYHEPIVDMNKITVVYACLKLAHDFIGDFGKRFIKKAGIDWSI